MAEPTPEAIVVMHRVRTSDGHGGFLYGDRLMATEIDAFASRRVAEKDAEIEGRVDFWKANAELHLAHIAALQAEIAALRAQVEWRPITDSWPPQHGNYARVYVEDGALLCPNGGEATHCLLFPAPPDTIPSKGEAE